MEGKIIDHLFRHQHGKMVSVLTRIFGFEHLETIEDAVQDTFIQAMNSWRKQMPENPEAWLMRAAKNRSIDLFRKIGKDKDRDSQFNNGPSAIALSEMFLDDEIEDSQLKMIFTACHPLLDPKDQIAFALKTISGFSRKEIAAALLSKEDNIKKRLQRARKYIVKLNLQFEIPVGEELNVRLDRVMEVIYVLFNEGFQSLKKDKLIRKDLCGEALRLCKILLNKKALQVPKLHALFALLCFHSSRLESKIGPNNEIINLADQDRRLWYFPLIAMGNDAMNKAVENNVKMSSYHYEAAIVSEHLRASSFEKTNWTMILKWYLELYALQPTENNLLNISIVQIQLKQFDEALKSLTNINQAKLQQREYLYYATFAEYFHHQGEVVKSIHHIDRALELVKNESERDYFISKKNSYQNKNARD